MTSKFSRAALIASLAVGASGLVAASAEAAAGVSTANYYVNNPAVSGAAQVTPESAVVSGAVDTGGGTESLLPIPTGGLTWDPTSNILIGAGIKWVDNTSGNYVPVDGIPISGSSSNFSATITDAKGTADTIDGGHAASGAPFAVSNGGVDNYSDVTFEYDTVADYTANGGTPGPLTQFAQDVQVPTAAGISGVSTTIGAFGQAAQNSTGNTPLTPGTAYYYWVVQQAGGTDQAVNVNVAAWADTAGLTNPANLTTPAGYNPTYKCYPIAAIEQDADLNAYYQAYLANQNPMVSYMSSGGTVTQQPAIQGPCVYYLGNTGGALYYQSPNGEFTTPTLGSIAIGKHALPLAAGADLSVSDKSTYKASGTIELTTKRGRALGTAKFSLAPGAKGEFKVKLTKKGKAALASKSTAQVVLTSDWDQPTTTKRVKL